jgi:phosphatidylserine decarboxylase
VRLKDSNAQCAFLFSCVQQFRQSVYITPFNTCISFSKINNNNNNNKTKQAKNMIIRLADVAAGDCNWLNAI